MNGIWLVIREAATSKKFIMAIAGAIAAASMKIGLELPPETVALILSPIITYLLAQGWADRGKEAAKIQGTVDLATSDVTNSASQTNNIPQAVKDKLL